MEGKKYNRKLDILAWLRERGMIESWELSEHFRLTRQSAKTTLWRLKKAGFIINMTPNRWELTEDGFAKLKYHDR